VNEKLKNRKLDLLLKELKLLDSEKSFIEEFTDYYSPIFLQELADNGYETPKPEENENFVVTDKPKEKSIEVNEKDEKLIKSIFRSIAKLAHPDKSKNLYRNKLYDEAQSAYEQNNLLVLYKIAKKLNIEVEINVHTISLLEKIIEEKKKEIKVVEDSFLWLWVNEEEENKKNELVQRFIDKHGKNNQQA
jgi:hypothetical protein